eukprot:TRINITY_DN7219_c0_g1_i2.p1 TRINITY_DN7219_c0_g1~~TRINITY_DN7219_c0_g1_i2.p1  ORF type:complete len:1589 (+),score=335.25 TRINITY_DN7219_c0_g1_i2:146-4912(+)
MVETGPYAGPGYEAFPECGTMYPLGKDGVLFMSRMTSLRAEDDKEKVADKVRRLLFATTGGTEVGCMRRARSPRRLEFYHDAVHPPRMFHTTKRLGHVLLALLGRDYSTGRAPYLARAVDLNPPLLDRSDTHTEIVVDAATIDAVSRSECALGASDPLLSKQLSRSEPPEGAPALDIYGPSGFRLKISELKQVAQSAKVATSSPLPPPFLQALVAFVSRPENRTFFFLRKDVPLREMGCEHRWRLLRQYWQDQVTAVKTRLACLENQQKQNSQDAAKAHDLATKGFTSFQVPPEYLSASHRAKQELKDAEHMLSHVDRLSEANLISQQWDEFVARVRRSPARYGFRTLQLTEATLARSLSYLAESVVVAAEHYFLVDGSHYRQNQLCGKSAQPVFVLEVAGLADPQCSSVDMVTLRGRLRCQYRLILAQCREHSIQTVSSSLVIGEVPYGVSDSSVREASLRALLEVLSTEEASSALTCWYLNVDGEEALKECNAHLERALSHGGVYNDPFTSRFLRCSVVTHNRNPKFLAVEMAKRATLTALIVPTTIASLLLGIPGGAWEHGRASEYSFEADVAATSTYLLSSVSVAGMERFRPERVLYDDLEGWGVTAPKVAANLAGFTPVHEVGAPGTSQQAAPRGGAPVGNGVASSNRWNQQQKDRFEKLLQNDSLAFDSDAHARQTHAARSPYRPQDVHRNPVVEGGWGAAMPAAPPARDLAAEFYGDPEGRGNEGLMAALGCAGESCIIEVYTLVDVERTARESFDALAQLPPGAFHLTYSYRSKERVVKTEAHFRTFYSLAGQGKVGMDGDLPELRICVRGAGPDGGAPRPTLPWSPEAETHGARCASPARGAIRRSSVVESTATHDGLEVQDTSSSEHISPRSVPREDGAPSEPCGALQSAATEGGPLTNSQPQDLLGSAVTASEGCAPAASHARELQRAPLRHEVQAWQGGYVGAARQMATPLAPRPEGGIEEDAGAEAAGAKQARRSSKERRKEMRKEKKEEKAKERKEKKHVEKEKEKKRARQGRQTADPQDVVDELADVRNLVGVDAPHGSGLSQYRRKLDTLLAEQREYENAKRLREEMVSIELRPVAPGPFDLHHCKVVVHNSLLADLDHVLKVVKKTVKYDPDLFYFDGDGDMVNIRNTTAMEAFVRQKWGDLMVFVKPKKKAKAPTYRGCEVETAVVSVSFNPPVLKVVGAVEQSTIEALSKQLLTSCPYLAHGRRPMRTPVLTFYAVPKPHWSVTYPHVHLDQTLQSVVFLALLDTLTALGGWELRDSHVTNLPVDLPRSSAEGIEGSGGTGGSLVAAYSVDFYKFVLQRTIHIGHEARSKEKAVAKQKATPSPAPLTPHESPDVIELQPRKPVLSPHALGLTPRDATANHTLRDTLAASPPAAVSPPPPAAPTTSPPAAVSSPPRDPSVASTSAGPEGGTSRQAMWQGRPHPSHNVSQSPLVVDDVESVTSASPARSPALSASPARSRGCDPASPARSPALSASPARSRGCDPASPARSPALPASPAPSRGCDSAVQMPAGRVSHGGRPTQPSPVSSSLRGLVASPTSQRSPHPLPQPRQEQAPVVLDTPRPVPSEDHS